MRASSTCRAMIKAWEGLGDGDPNTADLEPYVCPADCYTVGYGHLLLSASGQKIKPSVFGQVRAEQMAKDAMIQQFGKEAITVQEADELLAHDLRTYETEVNQAIIECGATQAQFDAMVSFCYNVGGPNFRSSSLLRLHRAGHRDLGDVYIGDLAIASFEKHRITDIKIAFARYAYQQGQWTLGLFRRRINELLVYGGYDFQTALTHAREAERPE